MIKIWIDADGCPVKDEVYRVAERYKVPVAVVANNRHTMVARAGSVVSGRFVGGDGTIPWTRLKVSVEFWGNPGVDLLSKLVKEVSAAADGSFTLKDVPEGYYRLKIAADLPASAYVADIRAGNASILDRAFPVDTGRTPGPIEIRMSRAGTRLEGRVQAEEGAALPPRTQVALVPEQSRRNLDYFKTVTASAEGTFDGRRRARINVAERVAQGQRIDRIQVD